MSPATADDVPAAFDAGAGSYDVLVNANPGYHDHLRISARRLRIPNGGRGLRLLDACLLYTSPSPRDRS